MSAKPKCPSCSKERPTIVGDTENVSGVGYLTMLICGACGAILGFVRPKG